MSDPIAIPVGLNRSLRTLASRLVEDGWATVRVVDHGINGDLLVELTKDETWLALGHDRGGPMIQVRQRGWTSGFGPDIWRRQLGIEERDGASSIEAEAQSFVELLPTIVAAIDTGVVTQEDLRRHLWASNVE
jgi:hypothetical protein